MTGETVVVHPYQPGAVDSHGNVVGGFGPDVTVDGVAVAPRTGGASAEPDTDRSTVIVGLTVYLPPGTVMGPHDEATVRGVRWQVVGEPARWTNPYSGVTHGVQAALGRTEG